MRPFICVLHCVTPHGDNIEESKIRNLFLRRLNDTIPDASDDLKREESNDKFIGGAERFNQHIQKTPLNRTNHIYFYKRFILV